MGVNKLHFYYGDGKGKTTAAMGMALRALGNGQTVLIGQFMKNGRSGEINALEQMPDVTCILAAPMETFASRMGTAQLDQAAAAQRLCVRRLTDALSEKHPNFIILDELSVAVGTGLLDETESWALVRRALAEGETIVTGRNPPAAWLANADYVSEIVKRKHPYDNGLQARKGVEW